MQRRTFLLSAVGAAMPQMASVMTVRGPVTPAALGLMLPHEHLFSNFGEEPAEPAVYDKNALLAAVLPYAGSVKKLGCATIADATTAYFGREPELLRNISTKTGIHVLTNTGYYAAASDRYVPKHAFAESADQLAARWLKEFRDGIGSTGIKPGFIKLGVDAGPLSEIDRKLVSAGARTHKQSGLTIAVHTGDNAIGAMEQLAILKAEDVSPEAWIWVHAHSCRDSDALKTAAAQGAWISLDGLGADTLDRHMECIRLMQNWGRLKQVLLSHDGNSFRAGGKRPMKAYSALFTDFVPMLRKNGFTDARIREMTGDNPARAYTIKVRQS